MLSNIRIVLVETSHPGNIGATARAMKTMGLSQLCLVSPGDYPCAEATARASGADDVLAAARVVDSLEEALAGCRLVIASSARLRTRRWPQLGTREAATQAMTEAGQGEVALVFGRERTGLTNDELDHAHYLVTIPANPDYSSLNLAAAVQVLAYELRMAHLALTDQMPVVLESDEPGEEPASAEDVERFFVHLQETLVALDFLDPENPRHLMRRLRRLFNRVRLSDNEINILRGILTAASRKPHKSSS
ncbi:MAG: tRNA (cytosine(32)/uridine(32)-2'-O)-methyltransferase TrmJ [Chromatiales bacterium]|nr:tRNA (cytosine(32)/uridine(32)-2'-O)-methyltransferase TrmJ [Chromatiales bacterium]